VTAEDSANVPLSSVLHVYVQVSDRNDHAPRASQPIYFASVPENSAENTVVVKIEAIDPDDPTADVHYRILRGDPQSFFSIDAKAGSFPHFFRSISLVDRSNTVKRRNSRIALVMKVDYSG
jgi:hypothetical protein